MNASKCVGLAVALAWLAWSLVPAAAQTPVVYVDSKVAGSTHNGSSWGMAYTSIQDGISAAAALAPAQVWVGYGTYSETVTLAPGVSVYGGFVGNLLGGYETSLTQRNPKLHVTKIDGGNTRRCVVGADDAVLDGFTIRRGRAPVGGALYNSHASPRIVNCILSESAAWISGGAVQNEFCSPVFQDCTFSFNSSSKLGGAMNNSASSPRIERCWFNNNNALIAGAIRNASASCPVVVNSVFDKNSATFAGAALADFSDSSSVITNCTFVYNTASGFGGAIASLDGNPIVTNCILWNGMKSEFFVPSPVASAVTYTVAYTVTYSDVQGGYTGTGNINTVPRFVDASRSNFRLLNGSPCVNAGRSASASNLGGITADYDGNTRGPHVAGVAGKTGDGSGYDMGAFENLGTTSSSVTFSDPAVEAAVRVALAKPLGTITPTDCATVQILNMPGLSITSLAGLENCIHLQHLDVHGNFVDDLSPLVGLANLALVDLADNSISDIAPLVENAGLTGTDGAIANLDDNPLTSLALCTQIPALRAAGVDVSSSTECTPDTDGDGLSNTAESSTYHTSPTNPDSDGDGLSDGLEVLLEMNPLSAVDGRADPDGDGIATAREIMRALNPLSADSDGDLMPDDWELQYGLDPLDPVDAHGDLDGDGHSNVEEYLLRSDPTDPTDPNASVFVSPTGVDSAGRGTRLLPYRTITYALAHVSSTVLNPVSLTLLSGTYTENVTMEPGLRLSGLPGVLTVIQGAVTAAQGVLLSNLEIHEPSATAAGFTLLTVNNFGVRVQDVTFLGNSARQGKGAVFQGTGAGVSLLSGCVFRSLGTGVEIYGALPTIRRTLFQNISGNAIWIHAWVGAKATGDGTLGNATDPNSGWLAFQDIDGYSVDNDRSTQVVVQHANWGTDDTDEIHSQVQGNVDTTLPLPKNASLVPASIACQVVDATTKAAITNGTVTLSPGGYTPVTENTGGVYSILCISSGMYDVSVAASGYTTKVQGTSVADGENAVVNIELSKGGGGGGCGGSKAVRTATAEKALPPSIEDDPAAVTSASETVAMHLTSSDPVAPASVWARADDGTALGATWRASLAGDDRDGWVVAQLPAVGKAEVAITVGALTTKGEQVGGYTRHFRVGTTKSGEAVPGTLTLDPATPSLPEAYAQVASPVYRISPKRLFDAPVTVRIPLAAGTITRGLQVFYYSESAGSEGWYEGCQVKGWLAVPKCRVVQAGDAFAVELSVNHGGVVQVGRAAHPQTGNVLDFRGGASLWLSFAAVSAVLSALLGRVRRKGSNQ